MGGASDPGASKVSKNCRRPLSRRADKGVSRFVGDGAERPPVFMASCVCVVAPPGHLNAGRRSAGPSA
jgi:hypothetical protein